MKRILLPTLLSAAYLLLLVAFFSTDFSKRYTFMAKPVPATSIEHVDRINAPVLRQVIQPATAHKPAPTPGGNSPESAGK
jgi:hypothetical protein